MGRKPGSGKRSSSFFYRTRRKIRYLCYRGTLFHSIPREERLKRKRSGQVNRQRRWRRRMRHIFFSLRPSTVKRFNRVLQAEIRASHEKAPGFGTLPGNLAAPELPVIKRDKKYSLHDRIYRPVRKMRFVYRQARKRRAATVARKKSVPAFRKILYLYRTGELFRIRFRPFLDYIHRNISFLGKSKFLIILINSTAFFLLGYLFVFVVKEFSVALAASSVRIKSVIFYHDVDFLIRSRDWTSDMVKTVYSTGPVITFLLALISMTIFGLALRERWMIRLFFLWVFYHALAQSLGDMIFGVLLNQGFGWVLAYLYYTDTESMLFVVSLLCVTLVTGIFLSRFQLLTGNIYFNDLGRHNRRPFLMSQVFLPFLLASGILILIKQPIMNNFDFVVEGSMLLLILPGIIRAGFMNDLYFDEEPRKARLQWIWILATIAALVLFRIYFWKGIRI